jgi:hypothetical protein
MQLSVSLFPSHPCSSKLFSSQSSQLHLEALNVPLSMPHTLRGGNIGLVADDKRSRIAWHFGWQMQPNQVCGRQQ